MVQKQYVEVLIMLHYWEYIRSHATGHILDIGIEDGNTWKMGYQGIHSISPPTLQHFDVMGLDIDDIVSEYPFIQCDVCGGLPFKNSEFDTAVLSQILEHVLCPDFAVQEALRVAKQVIITVPLGHSAEMESENADTMALHNPWIKYRTFIPDSTVSHHRHIRVFEKIEDLTPFLNNAKIEDVHTDECDGGRWMGVILRA